MRLVSSIMVTIAVVVLGAGNAYADADEGQGYISIMGSYIDDDRDRQVDDGVNGFQISLGKAINEHFNIEGVIASAWPDSANGDQLHFSAGMDIQRVFKRDDRFSPYLHVGFGYFQSDLPNTSIDEGLMFSGGAGFLLDLFDSNTALRAEYKHRSEGSGPSSFRDDIFSIGLQIPFGSSAPKFVDSDGDGIADSLDRCPNTRAGAAVDSYGCELDSDGDGVVDSKDKCPDTPAGVRVNASGCPVDSDGDGVTDDRDECPGTVAGAAVDANGCELDSDGDGVVDRLDACPGTAAGAQVDVKGCEIKEEIRLQGVNFETNSDRLLSSASDVLNDAAATLQKNPTIKVEVAGHTDSDGAAAYNESLSARRAQTVYDYLANAGVAEDRMTVRGYGEAQPIADNSTAAGKAENRRVVLRIVER